MDQKLKLEFNTVSKDRLFYDQYRYCMTAGIRESGGLRRLTHEYIDYVIQIRKEHRDVSYASPSWRGGQPITQDVVDNLHNFCQILIDTKHQFKLVVEFNNVRLYSNTKQLYQKVLSSKLDFKYTTLKEVIVDRPRDSIRLKNPQYKFRSYFNRAKMTDQQKQSIVQYFNNSTGSRTERASIRLSPCLQDWAKQSFFKWTESYYFVDHDDESWMIMLSLIRPGLIKKTNTIVQG
jgi:hypothetical protein